MSNNFVRVQEGADRLKGWDAEEVFVDGIKVYRQRVVAVPSGEAGVAESKGALRIDSSQSGITYVGKAVSGTGEADSLWQIKKILTTQGGLSILYPNGSSDYLHSWDDRASYTYS